MKCLITGGSGFMGSALAGKLTASGVEVWSASRRAVGADGCHLLAGDVTDSECVKDWLEAVRPDVVVHMSAQSLPGVSWKSPAETFECNVNGTINILTGMQAAGRKARFMMISSSSAYAAPTQAVSLPENSPLSGSSPYAWSKIAAEQAALLYGKQFCLDVLVVRPFFIIGPGKTGDVSSDFARRIVAVERGDMDAIKVGNLEITRDFLDIEDAVRGLETILEKGAPGSSYNLCSGSPVTIRQLLDDFKRHSIREIREEVDPGLIRPIDEPFKVGDCTRLKSLGWRPCVSRDQSVARILDHWRNSA
ncbi:MAG TPA: GDP-mannose 4,6-dehydratase [Kiritimatiellia bacterium]|nr:GDP-mannose 4,6-dehydratase [Kiritimatiellia bacterium]